MGNTIARDRFTWLMYLTLGYYAYLLNALGPVMPFLRTELGLSYTLSSVHFSLFAGGMLVAGLGTDRISKRYGRHLTFWFGVLGMALSTTMLLAGHHPWLTMPAAFLMGAIGTILLVIIPAVLTDRYGNQRAVAIAEANVVASLCSVLAPVIVGLFVGAKLSWRAALVIPVLVAFLFSLVFHQISLPDSVSLADRNHHAEPKLPGLYWAYWSILVLVVSVEFCIIFWGSTFLEKERGFVPANAAAVMSLFLGAMVVGRVLGSRLAYRVRSERLVLGSIGVCGLGFIVHWWTTSPVLTIAGLFVSGIGIANLYPQTLTLAVGVSATLTDQASARASLASGIAILVLPLILGGLADMIGLRYAYGLISVLLLLAGIGIILSDRKPPVPERPGYSCGR